MKTLIKQKQKEYKPDSNKEEKAKLLLEGGLAKSLPAKQGAKKQLENEIY